MLHQTHLTSYMVCCKKLKNYILLSNTHILWEKNVVHVETCLMFFYALIMYIVLTKDFYKYLKHISVYHITQIYNCVCVCVCMHAYILKLSERNVRIFKWQTLSIDSQPICFPGESQV